MAVSEAASGVAQPAARVPYGAALYLAVVQFLFATMWIVYVIFLPGLVESVGISRDLVIWILLLDQSIFVVMDIVMGVAADRVERVAGRLGPPILAASLLSCLAFLLIPQVTALGAGPATQAMVVGLILVWAVTSSVLRAPPWVMLAKYAAAPSVPWLAALTLAGLAVANAIAPYLALTLRGLDPRVPFALSSLTLLAVTAGLLWVERALAAQPVRGAAPSEAAPGAAPPASAPAEAAARGWTRGDVPSLVAAFIVGTTILAAGFQAHSAFNAAAQYLRFVQAADLPYLLPIFWIGFNLLSFPAAGVASRFGAIVVMAAGAVVGAVGTVVAALAPSLEVTILGQLVAGGAWGVVLTAGLAAAVDLGRPAREGSMLGFWFSMQAVATVLRMAIVAAELNKLAGFTTLALWAPPALWLLSGVLLAVALARMGRAGSARPAHA